MFSKVVLIALLGVLGRFQQHGCPLSHTYSCVLGDSTQLRDSTEHTVTKGAIARSAFRGRFVCIVLCLTLFSTALINVHSATHTPASWVNQPIYATALKTAWYKEPLLIMMSKVVLFVLLGVLRRFQHHICQITRTVHILMRPG